jgi:hypothetical protein
MNFPLGYENATNQKMDAEQEEFLKEKVFNTINIIEEEV